MSDIYLYQLWVNSNYLTLLEGNEEVIGFNGTPSIDLCIVIFLRFEDGPMVPL